MGMSRPRDDAALEELLGAFALDALEPEEVAEVEALLARRPDLAREADRLVRTAAWLGATEAIAARPEMRDELFARARTQRPPTGGGPEAPRAAPTKGDEAVQTYTASTERLGETLGSFDTAASDVPTPNGLTARDLVVHLAAQESLLAQAIDRTVVPEILDDDIDARTASFVARYREASLDEVTDVWRRSVDEVAAWADDPATRRTTVPWIGLAMPRDNFLVARAFENWIHRDDLRRAQGQAPEAPPPAELHEMANLSMRTLPFALLVTDRAHPGKVARVVLTGPGGGEWQLSMGGHAAVEGARPDVTLTTSIVDWCLVAGERLEPGELDHTSDGDVDLAGDLVAAAPTFATL
jgi:uncharacterized protein (TIGR03083 family)